MGNAETIIIMTRSISLIMLYVRYCSSCVNGLLKIEQNWRLFDHHLFLAVTNQSKGWRLLLQTQSKTNPGAEHNTAHCSDHALLLRLTTKKPASWVLRDWNFPWLCTSAGRAYVSILYQGNLTDLKIHMKKNQHNSETERQCY